MNYISGKVGMLNDESNTEPEYQSSSCRGESKQQQQQQQQQMNVTDCQGEITAQHESDQKLWLSGYHDRESIMIRFLQKWIHFDQTGRVLR